MRNFETEQTEMKIKEQLESQGISLIACVEAGKVYDKVEELLPEWITPIQVVIWRFIENDKANELFTLLKALYILLEIEVPEFMNDMEADTEQTKIFLTEFAMDWDDLMLEN